MRVCLATDSCSPSGMGVHMLALADAMADCAFTVLARDGTQMFREAAGRYQVRRYEEDEAALERWLRASGFDLVHVHAGIGWEGHAIVAAANRARVPVIRTEHLPNLLTDEGQKAEYAARNHEVATVIAVSEAVAASYRHSGLLASPLCVVRNGIGPAAANAPGGAARFERIGARPLVLNIGRMAAQKNQALLIETAALLAERGRPIDLMLVGDGPDRGHLVRRVRAAGLEGSVRFMGQRNDVPALIDLADLYVHASAFEGLPLVLLEVMRGGLPIVALRAPGVDETLDDQTAVLVDEARAESLAQAIVSALDDPADLTRRSVTARTRQATEFTAARMAAETRAIYVAHARKDQALDVIKVAFVGAGGIARRHLDVLSTMDDVRVVAVADQDTARSADFAARVGAEAHADWSAMLAAGGFDAVFVCVPPFAHGAIEDALIAAGLPFFVEKPVALSLAAAECTAQAIEARGLVTAVGYHWRWLDTLDQVRSALGGRQPRLLSGYWLDSTPPVDWWWKQALSGGQMTEQATHVIDLARYLCGEVDLAFGLAEHSVRPSHPDLDVATASTATLRFDSGAIGNFAATCLLGWNHRVGLHLFGDGFAIEITDHDVMIDTGHGRPVTPNQSDPVWHQDRAFIDAAMGRPNAIRCSYRDAVESLRVVDAIARSVAAGEAVRLDHAPDAEVRAA